MPATRAWMSCKGGTSSLGPLPDSGFMRPQSRRFNAPSSTSPRCRRGHRLGLGHPAGPSRKTTNCDDAMRSGHSATSLGDAEAPAAFRSACRRVATPRPSRMLRKGSHIQSVSRGAFWTGVDTCGDDQR